MRPPRPVGVLRALVPILGRAGRKWRGGPPAPMVWRRRRAAARPGALPGAARPLILSVSHAVRVGLVWTTQILAAPMERTLERVVRELLRPGSGPGTPAARGQDRLLTLIERLGQRSGRGTLAAAGQDRLLTLIERLPQRLGPAGRAPGGVDPAVRAGPRPGASPRRTRSVPDPAQGPAVALAAPAMHRRPAAAGPAPVASGRRPALAVMAAARRNAPLRTAAPQVWQVRGRSALPSMPAPRSGAPARMEIPQRPARPRLSLAWREPGPAGPGPAKPGSPGFPGLPAMARGRTEMVWRNPAALDQPAATAAATTVAAAAPPPGWNAGAAAHAQRWAGSGAAPPPAAAAAALMPAMPDVGRLVDEVVRRLERIGRDERLRRGI